MAFWPILCFPRSFGKNEEIQDVCVCVFVTGGGGGGDAHVGDLKRTHFRRRLA